MIREQATIEEAIKVLNRALEKDPEAMHNLIESRVRCNTDLGNDEEIQVTGVFLMNSGELEYGLLGVLGILNGVFGVSDGKTPGIPEGFGPITAKFNSKNKLVGFSRTFIPSK